MRKTGVALLVSGFLIAAVPAHAHHSFAAEFDITKPVQLEGTVVKMEWVNPHIYLHVEVTEPDGSTAVWAIEGGSPMALLRAGVRRDALKPGMRVVIHGFLAKNGKKMANGGDVVFTDGLKFSLASSAGKTENK